MYSKLKVRRVCPLEQTVAACQQMGYCCSKCSVVSLEMNASYEYLYYDKQVWVDCEVKEYGDRMHGSRFYVQCHVAWP